MHFNLICAPAAVNLAFGNIWIALVSEIWRHRNKHIFKGRMIDHFEIFYLAKLKVWSWVTSIEFILLVFSDRCLDPLVCVFSIKNKWLLVGWVDFPFVVLGGIVVKLWIDVDFYLRRIKIGSSVKWFIFINLFFLLIKKIVSEIHIP